MPAKNRVAARQRQKQTPKRKREAQDTRQDEVQLTTSALILQRHVFLAKFIDGFVQGSHLLLEVSNGVLKNFEVGFHTFAIELGTVLALFRIGHLREALGSTHFDIFPADASRLGFEFNVHSHELGDETTTQSERILTLATLFFLARTKGTAATLEESLCTSESEGTASTSTS